MTTVMSKILPILVVVSVPFVLVAQSPPNRVVLLGNEKVLEGDIERAGERIAVRRNGAETWIPAAQAVFIGPDLKSAYVFMQSKANLKLADERLRLAKWCHTNGMKSEAMHELEAALDLKPNWLPAITLLQQVKQTKDARPADAPQSPKPDTPPPDAVDCSPEAVKLFNTKVQPILMNTCAGCHCSFPCGKFELRRVAAIGPVNADNSNFNLAATSKMVDRQNPSKSPLLVKAITAHGKMSNPPLRDANAPAFKHLDHWVKLMAAEPKAINNGQSTPNPTQTPGVKDEFDPSQFNTPKKDG